MSTIGDNSAKKLRLRFPNGFEFEALGSEEFIKEQLQSFLGPENNLSSTAPPQTKTEFGSPGNKNNSNGNNPIGIQWEKIAEKSRNDLLLRSKLENLGQAAEACLILMAASKDMANHPRPSALELARWLRKSGYPIARIDRILQNAAKNGDILVSGSRRGRKYELSPSGRLKALLIAEKLSERITGAPNPLEP